MIVAPEVGFPRRCRADEVWIDLAVWRSGFKRLDNRRFATHLGVITSGKSEAACRWQGSVLRVMHAGPVLRQAMQEATETKRSPSNVLKA